MPKKNLERDYKSPKYKKFRTQVKKRDQYKCAYPGCKYRYRKVEVHHIIRWADSPGLRFTKANGITLCLRHHKRVTGNEYLYVELFMKIVEQNTQAEKKRNRRV